MNQRLTTALLWLSLLLLLAGRAHAALEIRITQGAEGAQPIAVLPFQWTGQGKPPQDIAAIVNADLGRSGQFAPLTASRFPQQPATPAQIRFRQWRNAGVDNLAMGQLIPQAGGRYLVQFRLFDTLRGEQILGYSIPATASTLRQAAHQISDYIYEKLLGRRGAFNTKVAYVAVATTPKGKRYTLQIADADGYGPHNVLVSKQPIMSPAWSPDGQHLAYVSFETGHSVVYLQNISSAKREKIADYPGINGAPAFSPDGSRLALTLSKGGNADIYILNLRTRKLTQLTHSSAIDTSAAWAPDGKSLIFTSDRAGGPQLYRISASGGTPRRLTYQGSYNASPAVSPDGKEVAMVHAHQGRFVIAVQDVASGQMQTLTKGPLDDSPSYAPNGDMILYSAVDGGRGVLAAVSADGKVHQLLVLSGEEVREPAWSPFLHP
ncbi:MAG: Tol-Pal system beta propeller repeat protein TolB [Gammaproteobacteria bacterium]|jgi:TolB protein